MDASFCIVASISVDLSVSLSSSINRLVYPVTSSTKASLWRWWCSCWKGHVKCTPEVSCAIQSSNKEDTNTHVDGPARLPWPCPWISISSVEEYDCVEIPKAVRRECCIFLRVSACIRHIALVAPSRRLTSIAMEHGTRSKQPVASLSKVAREVWVVVARLYDSSFSMSTSSACLCGRVPHWLSLRVCWISVLYSSLRLNSNPNVPL